MDCKDKFSIRDNEKEIDVLELEMVEYGGFDYGNGHALVLKSKKYHTENLFDARYDVRFSDEKSFHENSYEFVRDYVRKELEVIKM